MKNSACSVTDFKVRGGLTVIWWAKFKMVPCISEWRECPLLASDYINSVVENGVNITIETFEFTSAKWLTMDMPLFWKPKMYWYCPPTVQNSHDKYLICMMTSSNGNLFRVTGPLYYHRSPVNSPHKGQWRGALMFSMICLNKRLSKQSWGWWFETPSRPFWRYCNGMKFTYSV